MDTKESISFVIPCYNSTNTIEVVVNEITETMQAQMPEYTYEIVLVNDCSPDGTTFQKITELANKDSHIKGVNLARNFGQPSAVMAGMSITKGDYVVCGDDDGQTPFDELPKLFAKIKEGYDVVEAKYTQREKRSVFRRFGTAMNENMATWLTQKPKDIVLTSYWVLRRYVVEEILKYPNPYPYLGGLMMRTTQNVCNVEVSHRERLEGKSGYSFKRLLGLWLNGFTSFSVKPLRMFTVVGAITSLIGFIMGIVVVIRKIVNPEILAGYSSTMAVMLFLFGVLFMFLGLIGEYVGRIYISLNKAPQYVIKETINTNQSQQSMEKTYRLEKDDAGEEA